MGVIKNRRDVSDQKTIDLGAGCLFDRNVFRLAQNLLGIRNLINDGIYRSNLYFYVSSKKTIY